VLALAGADPIAEGGAARAGRPTLPRSATPGDLSLKLAGAGGEGAQTAGMLLTCAAIAAGFDATHIPSYGPESRGGTSYADVHIAVGEVLNPAAPEPDYLVAFNAPSLVKFAPTVAPGGLILYDATLITAPPPLPAGRRVLPVPLTEIARGLGRTVVKNMVALGALQAATGLLPPASFITTLRRRLKDKPTALPINEAAFAAGERAVSALVSPMA
jgi:Pyruvate/2-oxoacid:ferredoxin oxidoreductase gamma subunit